MREKIKIDEFQEDIDNGKLDITFDKLVNKAIELIKEIAKMKKLSIEDIDFKDKESLFYYLKKLFEENSASFQSIVTLMNNFLRWNIAPEDDFGTTKEEKIEMYIKNYNLIIYELDDYENVENEIKEKGYENLKNEKIEKLISIFKEMLDFLKVKYNTNDFYALKSLVMNNYPYFLDNIISLDFMMSNPTETYISRLNGMGMIYDYFSKSYRNHEENMKKYKEELEKQKIEGEPDFEDSEF